MVVGIRTQAYRRDDSRARVRVRSHEVDGGPGASYIQYCLWALSHGHENEHLVLEFEVEIFTCPHTQMQDDSRGGTDTQREC